MENTIETLNDNILVENEVFEVTETTEKFDNRHNNPGKPKKVYNIHSNNDIYLDYLKTLPESTAYQYGLTVKRFLASLGQKTPKRVTLGEIESFVNGKDIVNNHLRSFYKWAVKNNVGGTADDIQRSVLVWLV